MPLPIEIPLFIFLIATALVIANIKDLFAAAMLTGIFSLLSAGLFTIMDAVDVAFTEAAVGAGVSVVFFLCTLSLTAKKEYVKPKRIVPLLVVIVTGGTLFYGTLDMPSYGDHNTPVHEHLSKQFIDAEVAAHAHHRGEADSGHDEKHSDEDGHGADEHHDADHAHVDDAHGPGPRAGVGLPNMVTSVLGSYRGYDTFGETTVIFTAAIAVMMLMRASPRQKRVPPIRPNEEELDEQGGNA